MKTDRRFLAASGTEIFTGNELLVKGALESEGGVHLLGGYPGSPVAGFFDTLTTIKDLLNDKGIHAVINNNEALAAAMLNGTQTLPSRAMVVMKSVGVHVAADGLALANLAGAHKEGGGIIVYGDDPWSDSTQVPVDSRYISRHLFIPTIEPSNAQEVKDWVDLAFKLSAGAELIAGYIITTNLADGGGTVDCRSNHYPTYNKFNTFDFRTQAIDVNKRVLLPPKTWWQEESLSGRLEKATVLARELGLNRIEHSAQAPGQPSSGRKPLGFVAAGLGHDYLTHALWELGLLGELPILKLGLTYPVDPVMLEELAGQVERIVVVEERRGFMEAQVDEIVLCGKQAGKAAFQDVDVYGKSFPHDLPGIPSTRGLHPSMLMSLLAPLVKVCGVGKGRPDIVEAIDKEIAAMRKTEQVEVKEALPFRLATFCPGCPHRDTASLCLDIKRRFADSRYMKSKGREPVDLMFHGDIGCYTMLMYPPNTDLMHDLSGMGLGGSTGAGNDPFIANKEVVFMGDSTFFHSGVLGISQAIKIGQDITFIILDNSTTAMTGHQPTPGVDYDVLGNRTKKQSIEDVVRGLAGGQDVFIARVDPEQREAYGELLEDTFLHNGVKIIIADKECAITRKRRERRGERAIRKKLGYLPKQEHTNVNVDICRFCLACTEITGCPGLRHVETDYGTKVDTDTSWCVNDGACERLGACDSFERVTILRKNPPKSRVPELGLDDIPEPRKRPVGDLWQGCLTGVGGMGIGLATSILVRAGHKEGYRVVFLDKKGLAIRNGGVVSQVVYQINGSKPVTALITYGKADLLLGVDILEAARILEPAHRLRIASKEKTAAVINTDKIPTIAGLMGREDYDPAALEELIRRHTREDEFLSRNISRICEKYLGSKLYANIMMLGYAFQRGLIPVSQNAIAWAIKDAIRNDFRKNFYAFNMGRKFVESPDLFQGPPQRTEWKETLDSKCRWAARRYGKNSPLVDTYRQLAAEAASGMEGLNESLKRDLVIRIYDTLRWGGDDYARRYVEQVRGIYRKDRPEYQYAATGEVIHNLAAAMLIKDAIFKAELATAPEKYARDREKYNVNPANGDRIRYRYLWKRRLRLPGIDHRFEMQLRPWHMHWLKRNRWLRPLLRRHHRGAYGFRDRYEQRVAAFEYSSADAYRRQLARLRSRRCETCMVPSCQEIGCPMANDIPAWMELYQNGEDRAAVERLHETNNFPEFTGELCPAFCEKACHGQVNDRPVKIRDIERELVELGWVNGWITPQLPAKKTGRKVAIVGSGPAGLAAAQQLARKGHAVTVFEKDDQPGGLLRYGIPQFRLPRKHLDRRIEQLKAEGVEFRCGAEVGRRISAAQLRAACDAVLLAVGAHQPRDLDVPGRDSGNIVFAMDYLTGGEHYDVRGKTVAVIGAGLTGEDCIETALQQGAVEVKQFEILPRRDAASQTAVLPPETPEHLEQHWQVATKGFHGGNGDGGLQAVEVVRVTYTPSPKGPVMHEVPNSEFKVAADLAILAMGFHATIESALAEQFGLKTDEAGKIDVNENCAASVEGVWAAGDIVTGPSYVATAIDSGRTAADRIDNYLKAFA
ncbi:MAG: FAD-dependent oxidoreductase [Planctomycetes bacterium]|nr:FAD-dependent oxidoreductase [Planctomycetota bacterium]